MLGRKWPVLYTFCMNVILLVAGRSKRFWPLREKNLFPIRGKSLAEHQVERLRAAGCESILLVAGAHNKSELKDLFPELPLIEQTDLERGMQGALLDALPRCGSEPVMIVGGNDVVDPSAYADVRQRMQKGTMDGILLAKKVARYFPGGYLTLDGDRITGIQEKPGEGNEPSDLVNLVVHAHRDASVLLQALQDSVSDRDDAYERALDSLFKTHRYEAAHYEGGWQAVKYPWHLLELLPVLLKDIRQQRISPTAHIHPTAAIEGNVIIEDGVKIMPHACVMGPCFIGKGTIVGNNALVRQSSVGEHCVVGYNTEVKASVLNHHVWTHSTYIGDSVVGENVSFGAGSVTGNLRLDEGEIASAVGEEKIGTGLSKFGTIIGDHVRIGIHTGIGPGIKIGSESFIGSSCLVSRDIPEASFVVMKSGELSVRPNNAKVNRPAARDKFKGKIV
jgi:UDP-N-acetylglucosamine diphosphorylase / glucose-1-phosphate thymidylyltransferase / UDP-N-acetylgalactosamine diphosphorylase / glucosamine-1-phosphate N-acetyltransferase / galactosamine-1-phosphate N-acetyltransferase